jgi:hypothetical protein
MLHQILFSQRNQGGHEACMRQIRYSNFMLVNLKGTDFRHIRQKSLKMAIGELFGLDSRGSPQTQRWALDERVTNLYVP